MNEKLPQVIQESFFTKIKNWFNKFFRKQKSIENSIQENLNEINNEIYEDSKADFVQNIKVKNKDNILLLQRKIKEKQMEISELTDQELDEIIALYKGQIEEKKQKLKQYRRKIININAT